MYWFKRDIDNIHVPTEFAVSNTTLYPCLLVTDLLDLGAEICQIHRRDTDRAHCSRKDEVDLNTVAAEQCNCLFSNCQVSIDSDTCVSKWYLCITP